MNLGAEGVGLFRTEFLFLNAKPSPSEDQQFQAYTAVIRALRGRPIVIRTLDLGADKLGPYRESAYIESNPCLGLRSLRLSLRDPGLFRPQLRAILRASTLGDVRILFPLLTTLAELREAAPSCATWPPSSWQRDTPSAKTCRSGSWWKFRLPP